MIIRYLVVNFGQNMMATCMLGKRQFIALFNEDKVVWGCFYLYHPLVIMTSEKQNPGSYLYFYLYFQNTFTQNSSEVCIVLKLIVYRQSGIDKQKLYQFVCTHLRGGYLFLYASFRIIVGNLCLIIVYTLSLMMSGPPKFHL